VVNESKKSLKIFPSKISLLLLQTFVHNQHASSHLTNPSITKFLFWNLEGIFLFYPAIYCFSTKSDYYYKKRNIARYYMIM